MMLVFFKLGSAPQVDHLASFSARKRVTLALAANAIPDTPKPPFGRGCCGPLASPPPVAGLIHSQLSLVTR